MDHKIKRLWITLMVFFCVLSVFAFASALEYKRSVDAHRRQLSDALIIVKTNLESILTSRIISAQGLMSYIQIEQNFSQRQFEHYAEGLMNLDAEVLKTVTLLKDTVIINIYPYKVNESAIGRDLATVEGQKETVLDVKETGKMRLTAPVDLVQGGKGIVVRLPIAIREVSEAPTYWGQMSLVFDYDGTIETSQLLALAEDNWIQLKETASSVENVHAIWQNDEKLPAGALNEVIDLYQVQWTLSAIPKTGWHGMSASFWLILFLGVAAAGLSSFGIDRLIAAKRDLEDKVLERTDSLRHTNESLEQSLAELEENQAELTEVHDRLAKSFDNLKETQEQLITSEKLAALGELVAGVAHEINTPLGIGVTLSSYLESLHQQLKVNTETGRLQPVDVEEYIDSTEEALQLLNSNLERAASLVTSFKQVAADQASQDLRRFLIRNTIQDVLRSVHPNFKTRPYTVDLHCDPDLEIISYPGALSQILTNLIVNSLLHGFSDNEEGHILIAFHKTNKLLQLEYMDDGKGIPDDILPKVFNPFFSTRKQYGSTGLGLHIIHTIVTQTLGGQIQLSSPENNGLLVRITFEEDREIAY